jgi:hypothetical protein
MVLVDVVGEPGIGKSGWSTSFEVAWQTTAEQAVGSQATASRRRFCPSLILCAARFSSVRRKLKTA